MSQNTQKGKTGMIRALPSRCSGTVLRTYVLRDSQRICVTEMQTFLCCSRELVVTAKRNNKVMQAEADVQCLAVALLRVFSCTTCVVACRMPVTRFSKRQFALM